MANSGRRWIVIVGALLALVPPAEAAKQRAGNASKGNSAAAKAGLAVVTDSRGCKLWASESAAKRMRQIASQGSVTWHGVCKNGFISGTGVLREEGQAAIDGGTRKFAYYYSGSASKGVRTGRWKRESFEQVSGNSEFTAGIATIEFVNGIAVGAPKPVATSSWSQYSVNFSTRILAPALKEQSRSTSASASERPLAGNAADVPAAKIAVAAAPAPASAEPVPASTPAPPAKASTAKLPAAPVAVPAASPPMEASVKLTTQPPAFVEGQSFTFGFGCYMDTLDGQLWESQVLTVKNRKAFRITGWGVDTEGKRLSEATYLRLEHASGRRFYAATTPEDRPDVAEYLGQAAFVKSGYRALVSAENLPAGEYEAMIVMNVGGRNLLCGNGRKLRLQG